MPKGSEQAYSTPSNGGLNKGEVTKGFKVLEKPTLRTPEHDPQYRENRLKENIRDAPFKEKL